MDNELENKTDLRLRLINFFNFNKFKIYLIIFIFIGALILFFAMKLNIEKKNYLIADKYIQAGIYLSLDEKNNSKRLYEEIILSKNKFYSILALNGIIENNLENNQDTILEYFAYIENLNHVQENLDLLKFKKALFLLKNSQNKKGNELLQDLIDNNSNLKSLASEIINK